MKKSLGEIVARLPSNWVVAAASEIRMGHVFTLGVPIASPRGGAPNNPLAIVRGKFATRTNRREHQCSQG